MEHDFYNLEEAAKELECEINDLLKLGAAGKIELRIYYEGENLSPEYEFSGLLEQEKNLFNPSNSYVKKFLTITKEDIMRVYQEHNDLARKELINKGITLVEWNRRILEPFPLTARALFLSRKNLNILKTESLKSSIKSASPSLDENHSFHATELKMAVEAWTALFENKEIGDPLQMIKEKPGGSISTITKWLENRYPNVSRNAHERIAKVVNPFKAGGSPKKSE